MSGGPAPGDVIYRHEWLTTQRQDVVNTSRNLQRALVKGGYYVKVLSPENSVYKQAQWILRSIIAYSETRTWCPESQLEIGG